MPEEKKPEQTPGQSNEVDRHELEVLGKLAALGPTTAPGEEEARRALASVKEDLAIEREKQKVERELQEDQARGYGPNPKKSED